MKINANLIRPGNILEHNGRQYAVLKTQIVQPGKGGAFITVEMRDIRTGNKTNERWRTADTIEKCNVEAKECTFLFRDDDHMTFMDSESYEQFTMPAFCLAALLFLMPPTRLHAIHGGSIRNIRKLTNSSLVFKGSVFCF